MPTDPPKHNPREADRLVYGGLIGLGAAAVIQLADKPDLGDAHLVAVHCFAAAIPLLAAGLVADYARQAGTRIPPLYDLIGLSGALASVAGFASLLFHFGILPGVLFLGLAVVAFVVIRRLD